MKLIAINALNKHLKSFWKRPNDQRITLLTFKKDRSLTIVGVENTITIIETGYRSQTYSELTITEAKHQFKHSFATEFPRSHNVYFEQYKKN